MNRFITALKENENDIRKKVLVAVGITTAAVVAGVVLAKMKDQSENVLVVIEEAAESVSEATAE